jgi:hypothetical protein
MTDDRLEEALKELGETYNRPPETPRHEMWAGIRDALPGDTHASVTSIEAARKRKGRWWRRGPGVQWTGLAVAAAALLVLGIGIGRVSVNPLAGPETAASDGTLAAPAAPGELVPGAGRDNAFRYAAVEHLLRSESLLTMVRTDARAGRYDAALGGWARDLLMRTRLLMDSPAAEDPALGELLEDLELILVQLARFGEDPSQTDRGQEELDLIARGMEEQEMLLRIRAVVPAGAGLVGA